MGRTRIFAVAFLWATLSGPSLSAEDLSRYREFYFGMNLLAVVKQAGMQPSDATVIHRRPAVIQELKWQPWRFPGSSEAECLFEPFGNVERVNVITDRDTGRSRGFAFVEERSRAKARSVH